MLHGDAHAAWTLIPCSVHALHAQVYVWNANSCSLQYKLPGHSGSVNQVIFHPKEPIIASASSDRNIFMGELMQ
jgi:WD40 repeat protein